MDELDFQNEFQNEESAYSSDIDYGKKIKSIPRPERNIGIDQKDSLISEITQTNGTSLNTSEIESFSQISQNRDELYSVLDSMSNDSVVSSILEIYAEDATERNEEGKIVYVKSDDENVSKYVTFLLDSINVDKNIYKWVYSLCKYGDLYIKLFRESDYEDNLFQNTKGSLKENINIVVKSKTDNYSHYVEMVSNPAEMFELTKHGKTYAYIQAPINSQNQIQTIDVVTLTNNRLKYKFRQKDISIYRPTEYVHASLEDNPTRYPEEVEIFLNDSDDYQNDSQSLSYSVKKGQSLLQSSFKSWRQLMLLENSILLNRTSKSSIVRVIGIEVGDMPKEQVGPHLQGVKSLIEQKASLEESISMSEYANNGPIENNIYIPTRNGQGTISTQQIGGDVDIKSLADLDYFKNRFFGSTGVPSQFIGFTDDATGFNGGTSLSIISSRYAKRVKKLQNCILQTITDIINLFLIDKGLDSYINKFELHIQTPTTQEEIDRRDNLNTQVGLTRDIMDLLSDIEDPISRLKILKVLLSNFVTQPEIVSIIQEEIDKGEELGDLNTDSEDIETSKDLDMGGFNTDNSSDLNMIASGETLEGPEEQNNEEQIEEPQEGQIEELPSPESLGIDFTDNNNF